MRSLEFEGDSDNGDEARADGHSKLVLCDWKLDQFALRSERRARRDSRDAAHYRLYLIDVDSLAPYLAGTRFHERQVGRLVGWSFGRLAPCVARASDRALCPDV